MSNMMMYDGPGYVVGIGELLWDCFPKFKRIGGAPVNFAYHAAQFGFSGVVISSIGADELGKELLQEMEKHGLYGYIYVQHLPTGTVDVCLSDLNDPHYRINTEVAWANTPYSHDLVWVVSACKAVCFGSLAQYGEETRKTIEWFMKSVDDNCYKIFDINLRDNAGEPLYCQEVIQSSLNLCNMLKVNIAELHYVAREFDLEGNDVESLVCSLMSRYGNINTVIVTLGSKGSWVFGKDDCSYLNTPKVSVIDVVGAGDAFTGAFIGSLLTGKTLKEAHHIAVMVSAYVCTQKEGMPSIPEWIKNT